MAMIDAEEARQACSKALVKFANGNPEAAKTILSEFAQKCHRLTQAEKMETEQETSALGAGSLDLGELRQMVQGKMSEDAPEIDWD